MGGYLTCSCMCIERDENDMQLQYGQNEHKPDKHDKATKKSAAGRNA